MDLQKIEHAFRDILIAIGENPDREGLQLTPSRVATMYKEIFSGINKNPEDYIDVFKEEHHEELVLVKDIPFYSICEHHFLPFVGKAHVAYIPRERVVGISKLARTVDFYARQPQIQERMTRQIAELIQRELNPKGVAVVLEATHSCMTIRGIKKQGSVMCTTQLLGLFKTSEKTRAEFMATIHSSS